MAVHVFYRTELEIIRGQKESMEIFNLFMTAFIPVLKVHFLTALGLFLALERIDILGAVARKHLNDVSLILILIAKFLFIILFKCYYVLAKQLRNLV